MRRQNKIVELPSRGHGVPITVNQVVITFCRIEHIVMHFLKHTSESVAIVTFWNGKFNVIFLSGSQMARNFT